MLDANPSVQVIRNTLIRSYSQRAAGKPDGIDLAIGDLRPPHFGVAAHIRDAMKRALDDGLTYYPPLEGIPELRHAIAAKLAMKNRVSTDPDREILVTAGATEALFVALASLVRPGDEVLIPDPCHDVYEPMVRLVQGTPVRVPFRVEEGFQPAVEAIERRVSPRTRLIWINTPNSPTGSVFTRETLIGIAGVATAHKLWILSDEPYECFVYDGARHISIASLCGVRERTATAYAFSKSYAMTGLRIGYLVAPAELIGLALKVHRNIVSCASLIAQKAAVAALIGPEEPVVQLVGQLDQARRLLVQGLNSILGIRCFVPTGAFYAYPDISGLGISSREFADLLLEQEAVAVVPGENWGTYRSRDYVRISYSQPPHLVEEAIERIRRVSLRVASGRAATTTQCETGA